jgi:hypothetical protein
VVKWWRVSDQPSATNDSDSFPIDLRVARLARVENYLVGGEANFAVDRSLAEEIADAAESRLDGLRGTIEALKVFAKRAVRILATDEGVRQFLYVGMATPTEEMVHDVALRVSPDSRVVYASYDPTTLAHVRALWRTAPEGAVGHVQSSFGDTKKILAAAAETLDLDRPVAVLLPTSLNLVADDEVAQRIVDDLRDAIVPGSYVIMAHTSVDIGSESTAKIIEMINAALEESYVSRSAAEILALLHDLELLEPGLVPVERWRNEGAPPVLASGRLVPILGAVGRKP